MPNKKIIILMLISIFLIGCRTSPILEITDAPINTASGQSPKLSTVTKKIIEAGISKGWQMKKVQPGSIMATIHLREHMVQIMINYTPKSYSISYKDSTNMKYDDETATVHANYNNWITNLSNAINTYVYNGS
jgi:PBP1b-binding outer membrane lipoprotein LpoB